MVANGTRYLDPFERGFQFANDAAKPNRPKSTMSKALQMVDPFLILEILWRYAKNATRRSSLRAFPGGV
jgi:hypothetical protein